MNTDPPRSAGASFPEERLGFVCDDETLPESSAFAADARVSVLVHGPVAPRLVRARRQAGHNGTFLVDGGSWRKELATVDGPTALSPDGSLFGIDINEWATDTQRWSGASFLLSPSLFVAPDAWGPLNALIAELARITHRALIPFLPVAIEMLDTRSVGRFLDLLTPLRAKKMAILFAGRREMFARTERLRALRVLLTKYPDAWIVGVDPLVATDALAHGAGYCFVGTRSGLRRPAQPGASNGAPAKGFIPGLFHRELLAMRSPSIYADWYVDVVSPTCSICGRPVDRYSSNKADKRAIVAHNLHAIQELVRQLDAQPRSAQPRWLHDERVAAMTAHYDLNQAGVTLEVDTTLRRLCEMDDPLGRSTTPVGSWT